MIETECRFVFIMNMMHVYFIVYIIKAFKSFYFHKFRDIFSSVLMLAEISIRTGAAYRKDKNNEAKAKLAVTGYGQLRLPHKSWFTLKAILLSFVFSNSIINFKTWLSYEIIFLNHFEKCLKQHRKKSFDQLHKMWGLKTVNWTNFTLIIKYVASKTFVWNKPNTVPTLVGKIRVGEISANRMYAYMHMYKIPPSWILFELNYYNIIPSMYIYTHIYNMKYYYIT